MMLSSNGSRVGESGVSTMRRLCLALAALPCLILSGPAFAYAPPSAIEEGGLSPLANAVSAAARFAQAQPAPSPAPQPARPPASPSASPAPSPAAPSSTANTPAQAPAADPIGNVATLTGTATAIRNRNSLPLKLKDDIYLNDVLVTSSNSTLGVTFNDATTFNLTANARITVDNYIYEDNGKNNSALFDIARGTVAFAAASVAKNGDMKITTPSTSLGIRGTTGLVEVEPGATATSANNIKLYPDADGRVGHIDINDRNGARLGSLTQGASGFTVRPGAGGRLTATPLAISPQQAARDQGIVRQVHAAQVVGRRVVTEQRALRQANPNRNNPRGAPGQPGGPQRQNNQQQRPGAPQQPGSPNRTGQPGQPGQPAQPNRPGQQGQPPASPNAPGQQQQQHSPGAQRQPGARQPANKPAPAIRRPPPPKGKKKKPF